MHPAFQRRIFQVSRREVGYLRFTCEGYDGLFFLRTLDPQRALVEVSYAPEREREVLAVLAALHQETGWQDVSEQWMKEFGEL